LQELQRARPDTLRRFFHQHNCRDEELIEQRIESLRQAVTATHDPALLQAGSLTIRSLVQLIARLREEIVRHEQKIEDVAQAHPDFPIMDSLPGAGRALAPRLIAALGTDRSRFQTAQQLQCYTGIAPVLASSGQQRWVHSRWACPKFVRQTIHEWAQHSIAGCPWARRVLPGAALPRQIPPHRGSRFGVPMASHSVSLLAGPHALPGTDLSAGSWPACFQRRHHRRRCHAR